MPDIDFAEPKISFFSCIKHENLLRELGKRNNLIISGPHNFNNICGFFDCKEQAQFVICINVKNIKLN